MNLSIQNIKENEPQAEKVWFAKDTINIQLTDGRVVFIPLSFYPLLRDAPKKVREDFRLFGEGTAIHFNALDEDISIEALVHGRKQVSNTLKKNNTHSNTSNSQ